MSKEVVRRQWADDDDDEDRETQRGSQGVVRERVTFSVNAKNQKVRTITKFRQREVKTRVPKRVATRKELPRFGDAKIGEENVTLPSKDFVSMEHPDDQLVEDVDDPSLAKTLANFILKQQETKLARDADVDGLLFNADGDLIPNQDPGEKSDKYVAPGRGGAAAGGSTLENAFKAGGDKEREMENTIRVSNLTKEVTEDDLRALFEPFGRVFRISLPRGDRLENGKMIKEPRGFAYIAFVNRPDAEKAMERLQGHGYGYLILKLEWAKATTKEGAPGGEGAGGGGFRSGYGKQLAQDTKEKVSYASNLTANR